jgi:hypothetical protein
LLTWCTKIYVFSNMFLFGQLLSSHETLQAYSSVYYVGTIVPVAIILFGLVVKPPRAGNTIKTKKVQ